MTMPADAPANAVPAAPPLPPLAIGGFTLRSRLVVGTGKYRDYPTMQAAIEASGAMPMNLFTACGWPG